MVEAKVGVGWFSHVVSATGLTVYEPREAEGCWPGERLGCFSFRTSRSEPSC